MRSPFTYRGCTVYPCDYYPQWKETNDPIDFGDGKYRTQFWRVEFPDDTWVKARDKRAAQDYIDKHLGKETE